jgi:hypothetical protein
MPHPERPPTILGGMTDTAPAAAAAQLPQLPVIPLDLDVVLRIAFIGCAHLGYRMSGMRRTHPSGLNIREVDGYVTHEIVYNEILASGAAAISNGGDLFHVHHPSMRAINEAKRVDSQRAAAGIPEIDNGGNHDNGASSTISAIASVHQPELGRYGVFPDPGRPAEEMVGPHPGYYEVHQPIPEIPLFLHVVSHNGLDPKLADRGINIDPQPIPDAVNILVSHGIFSADGRLFGADDRHGAERVIPEEWATRGWDQSILSDFHTPGPIPGFGPADGRERGQVWMTGSLIGRGFSDELCSRGWLMVDLTRDGRVTVTPRYVWKRPQIDFDTIDARGKTVEEINGIVRTRLAADSWWDEESASLTGDGGYLLRQKIANATPAQRHGIRALAGEWAEAAGRAAFWKVDWDNPLSGAESQKAKDPNSAAPTPGQPRTINWAQELANRTTEGRVGATLAGMPDDLRTAVLRTTDSMLASLVPADQR